jgi:hypothetical protein
MTGKKIYFLILCLWLFGIHNFSSAQRMSFHLSPGAAFPKEKKIHSSFESGFGFSLPLIERIFLSLNFVYWKSSVEEKEGSLMNGELSVTPFFFSLEFRLMENKKFNPYIFLGANLVFTRFEIGKYISIPEVTINQEVRNGPGLHFGGGIDFSLTGQLALFVEGFYFLRKAKAETTIKDMNFGVTTEEFLISLDSLILQIGIKYFF